MQKVLWFNNTPASGAEYLNLGEMSGGWLSALDKALSDKVELHIAFYYPKPTRDFLYHGVLYHPITRKNYRWNFIKAKLFGDIKDREDLPVYLELVKSINPDIIHIHGTENPFGCIISEVGIPVAVSIQGIISIIFHKYLSGLERKYLSIMKASFKRVFDFPFYYSFRKDLKAFEKMRIREIRNLNNARFVIGRTDWDRRITRVLAPESKYFRGEEMLRESFYNQVWQPVNNERIIIHTTNSNSPFKGFETVCYALTLLNNIGLEIEWRIAGINKKDLIVKVAKKSLGKHYPDKGLVFLGALNENQLVEKLLEAHIFVMPSHIENSSNSLCEAMLLGMPCIASYAGGTGSLLRDGEEGILIQDGDPWALAGSIIELSNNPEMALKYGIAARVRALVRHDKNKIVEELLKTYTAIIARSK